MSATLDRQINTENLLSLANEYGNAFYLLDTEAFRENYQELSAEFKKNYPKFNIAYSYKTNYIPDLVKIVYEFGGFAEVVSDMELEIALRCGVPHQRIIWNGPIKDTQVMENFLLHGGTVNIDSTHEADNIREIALKHNKTQIHVGVRCNFDVQDGVLSRFGVDVDGEDFDYVLKMIGDMENIALVELQCHFAKRDVKYWAARTDGMLRAYDKVVSVYGLKPQRIDLGGGIYGKMPDSLKEQLHIEGQNYADYAEIVTSRMSAHFANNLEAPELFLEPGSALVGDCMKFVTRIETIKSVRGKAIATVLGSQKNISMSGINPPYQIIFVNEGKKEAYTDLDIVGFTCIEGDCLVKNYMGELSIGDFLVISNCGSYSVVMKPPFILPNFTVLDICKGMDQVKLVKRAEKFDDLFQTYSF